MKCNFVEDIKFCDIYFFHNEQRDEEDERYDDDDGGDIHAFDECHND